MSPRRAANTVIFTDIDHTLLDAQGPGPAGRAIARVRGIPVIPATSKTAAETIVLLRRWGLQVPAVVENGAALCLPIRPGRWCVRRLTTVSYGRVRAAVRHLRRDLRLDIHGFGDWRLCALMHHTGLGPAQALAARARLASEPLLWTADAPAAFVEGLRRVGLKCIAGGRFLTVLPSPADKAAGARALLDLWCPRSPRPRIVALGDAPNDRCLLEFADLAVCMPGPRPLPDGVDCLRHPRGGPQGWLEALQRLGLA